MARTASEQPRPGRPATRPWPVDPVLLPVLAIFLAGLAWLLLRPGGGQLLLPAAAVAALGAAVAGRPVAGTLLTLALAPISLALAGADVVTGGADPYGFYSVAFFNVFPHQVAALVTAAAVAIGIASGRRSYVTSPCGPPFLLLAAMIAFSPVISAYPLESVRQVLKVFFGLLPTAWIVLQTLRTRREVEAGLLAFFAGSAANALVGLAQVALAAGWEYKLFAAQTRLPNGLTGESSMYGVTLSLAIAAALPIAWRGAPRRLFAPAVALLPLAAAGLILSGNRSGWGAAVAVSGATALLFPFWRVGLGLPLVGAGAATAAGALALAGRGLPYYFDMLATKLFSEDLVRPAMIQGAIATWRNPLWGNGVGSFMPHLAAWDVNFLLYSSARGGALFNLFGGVLYDTGLVGLAALLWLLAAYLRAWWRSRPAPGDAGGQALRAVALTMLLASLINAQMHVSWQFGVSYALFALGLAILKTLAPPAAASPPPPRP